MEDFGYRKLLVYSKAKQLVFASYKLIRVFPKEENYALSDQIRRSAVSVTSNIAEGLSRFSVKDKVHFLQISHGSLMELTSQFEIAALLGYITPDQQQSIDILASEIGRMLNGLAKSFTPR